MKIVVDTHVVLDLLLAREPFARDAGWIFSMGEKAEIDLVLCATTVTTIDYLLTRGLDRDRAKTALRQLISLCEIAPVHRAVIEAALDNDMNDFEDAVLVESARTHGAQMVITRNVKDFAGVDFTVLSPAEFIAQLGGEDE